MEDVYDVMARLEQASHKIHSSQSTAIHTPVTTGDDSATHGNKVQLPKLMIQPFKGELTAWSHVLGFVQGGYPLKYM